MACGWSWARSWSWVAIHGSPRCCARSIRSAALLGLPFLFAGLFVKLKQEERLLLERFGPEYEKCRAEVPALIPRL